MKPLDDFDALAADITPDPQQAMIILEAPPGQASQAEVTAILRAMGAPAESIEVLRAEPRAVLLVRIDTETVHDLVLKLSSSGFTRLKAVHPRPTGGATGR